MSLGWFVDFDGKPLAQTVTDRFNPSDRLPIMIEAGGYQRLNQVRASYYDHVCYLALEKNTGVQVFWYEFLNDGMSREDQELGHEQILAAQQIKSSVLLRINFVRMTTDPPRYTVVTEAVQSPSMADYVQSMKAPLPIRTCIKWFHNLCEAVSALHSANLVHSAISLHSVFIKPATGTLKLKLPLTSLSRRLIPPNALDLDQYKAPELLNGIRDKANDIWSLGIILLELVTTSTAYAECETPQQLIQALIDNRIPAAIQSVQNPVVAEFIRKCLAPFKTRLTIEMIMAHPIQDVDGPAVEAQATQPDVAVAPA
jgi:serine/threonine protein kinase